MKKLGIALGVSICVLVYLFLENSHLKNEIGYLKEDIEEIEGKKVICILVWLKTPKHL